MIELIARNKTHMRRASTIRRYFIKLAYMEIRHVHFLAEITTEYINDQCRTDYLAGKFDVATKIINLMYSGIVDPDFYIDTFNEFKKHRVSMSWSIRYIKLVDAVLSN